MQPRITVSELKELINYDPDTGEIRWKKGRPGASSGNLAGTLKPSGYVIVLIKRKLYRAHRIAWFYMTGEFPTKEIDHINGNKSDNRFCNLRLADKTQNNWNKKVRKDSKVGIKNVLYFPNFKKYYVRINANKQKHQFGPFDTIEEAAKVAEAQRAVLHAEFAHVNHAKPSISSSHSECCG